MHKRALDPKTLNPYLLDASRELKKTGNMLQSLEAWNERNKANQDIYILVRSITPRVIAVIAP